MNKQMMQWLVGLGWLAASGTVQATSVPLPTPLVTDLAKPWAVVAAPTGILITERSGQVKFIPRDAANGNQLQPAAMTTHDLRPADLLELGQGGLLDLEAIRTTPEGIDYWLSYSCGTAAANHTCVAQTHWNGTSFSNPEPLFKSMPAKAGGAHFSGRLLALPDGRVLLSVGDGFDYREQAQQLDSQLGKVLQLLPTEPVQASIFTRGHRNVQGLVFDPERQRVLAHEHGPRGGDEINILLEGENYGWPLATHGLDYTGAKVTPYESVAGTAAPLYHWTPSIAPSGMALWRDQIIVTSLAARAIHVLDANRLADGDQVLLQAANTRWRDVLVTDDQRILLLSDGTDAALYDVTEMFESLLVTQTQNQLTTE